MASTPRSRRLRPSATKDTELTNRRVDQGVTRYYRLYELLLAALQDGSIAPDSALPSEPELCARYGISRTTVRRALDRLEREGCITRRRGSGTYARPQRTRPRVCFALNALSEIQTALDSRALTTTLRFGIAPVPQALRAIAGDIGPTAYVLERILSSGGEPLSLIAAYLPESLGRRLQRPLASRASLITLLARLGRPAAAVRCSLAAIPADAAAARGLQLPPGSPLLRVRAALSGGAGELLAVLESLCRSDRLQLKLTEPRQA